MIDGFVELSRIDFVSIIAKKASSSNGHKNFIIKHNHQSDLFYSGKGKWSSTPIVFSTLDNALRAVGRAKGVILAEEFVKLYIKTVNKQKIGEYQVMYGITFKKSVGEYKEGYKCNHIKYKPHSSKVRIFDEDDTIIGIINFSDEQDDDE